MGKGDSKIITVDEHNAKRRLAKSRKKSKGIANRDEGFSMVKAKVERIRRERQEEEKDFLKTRSRVVELCATALFTVSVARPLAKDMSPQEIFEFTDRFFHRGIANLGVHPVEGVKESILDRLHEMIYNRKAA